MLVFKKKFLGRSRTKWAVFAALLISPVSVYQALAQPSLDAGRCYMLAREPALSLIEPVQAALNGNIQFFVEATSQSSEMNSIRREDIAIQLEAANTLFQDVLGLTPPLQMPRYQRAGFIMVVLRTDQLRGGQAYDEVVRNPSVPECHIRMALGGSVEAASNLTPAHELFHLYQNAHMMFKQGWVHEGLARWSESLLSGNVQLGPPLPTDRRALESVMQSSYEAVTLWQRLLYLVDSQGRVTLPPSLEKMRYHDGRRVVALERIHGSHFLAHLFDTFHHASLELAKEASWAAYEWSEREQRSLSHNPVILAAIQEAVLSYLPEEEQPDELRDFMQLVSSMLD